MSKVQIIPLRRGEPGAVVAEMSDEALLAACAVQDGAALGALFDRHHKDVFRFVSRIGGYGVTARDAEDLVQETFVQVWRSASRFSGGSAIRTWIFGIAANLTRQYLRGETRRNRAMGSFESVSRDSQPPPGPEQLASDRQRLVRFERAFDGLGHDHKVALAMCDIEGISGVDAARALGVRPGTIWRRRHEARAALRSALGEGEGA